MTTQECFNKMWTGLEAQKWERCVDFDDRCRFHFFDKKCAIGHVITNEMANMTYTLVGLMAHQKCRDFFAEIPIDFLLDAQHAHDRGTTPPPHSMKRAFKRIAKKWKLTIPENET